MQNMREGITAKASQILLRHYWRLSWQHSSQPLRGLLSRPQVNNQRVFGHVTCLSLGWLLGPEPCETIPRSRTFREQIQARIALEDPEQSARKNRRPIAAIQEKMQHPLCPWKVAGAP